MPRSTFSKALCVTAYLCMKFQRVFRRSTSMMQKIGASDGDRCSEGNLAAVTVPSRLGPRQKQQGGGQIKNRERQKEGGGGTQRWKYILRDSRYTVCHCTVNPTVCSLVSESRVEMCASLLCNTSARITSQTAILDTGLGFTVCNRLQSDNPLKIWTHLAGLSDDTKLQVLNF